MKKVCFAGAYGMRCQGDDAALVVLAKGLRQRIGDFEGIVITRPHLDDSYLQYGLKSIRNIEYDKKAESIGKWFYGFNHGDDPSHLTHLME